VPTADDGIFQRDRRRSPRKPRADNPQGNAYRQLPLEKNLVNRAKTRLLPLRKKIGRRRFGLAFANETIESGVSALSTND
jgi:hypothetical protein